jgi:hypothetical protein
MSQAHHRVYTAINLARRLPEVSFKQIRISKSETNNNTAILKNKDKTIDEDMMVVVIAVWVSCRLFRISDFGIRI